MSFKSNHSKLKINSKMDREPAKRSQDSDVISPVKTSKKPPCCILRLEAGETVTVGTQCGMTEILDGNRCQVNLDAMLSLPQLTAVSTLLSSSSFVNKCLTLFHPPGLCKYRHSRQRYETDNMHFWTIYYRRSHRSRLPLCAL